MRLKYESCIFRVSCPRLIFSPVQPVRCHQLTDSTIMLQKPGNHLIRFLKLACVNIAKDGDIK